MAVIDISGIFPKDPLQVAPEADRHVEDYIAEAVAAGSRQGRDEAILLMREHIKIGTDAQEKEHLVGVAVSALCKSWREGGSSAERAHRILSEMPRIFPEFEQNTIGAMISNVPPKEAGTRFQKGMAEGIIKVLEHQKKQGDGFDLTPLISATNERRHADLIGILKNVSHLRSTAAQDIKEYIDDTLELHFGIKKPKLAEVIPFAPKGLDQL